MIAWAHRLSCAQLARDFGEAKECVDPTQAQNLETGIGETSAQQRRFVFPEVELRIVRGARVGLAIRPDEDMTTRPENPEDFAEALRVAAIEGKMLKHVECHDDGGTVTFKGKLERVRTADGEPRDLRGSYRFLRDVAPGTSPPSVRCEKPVNGLT
jgi:hypothetical protein